LRLAQENKERQEKAKQENSEWAMKQQDPT
jgi:hypothetical protein